MNTERNHVEEAKQLHACGATSSYCPDFAQIPREALIALADRFTLGETKHKRHNWRKGLGDKAYTLARLNHIINHTTILIAKIEGFEPWNEDDDVGAILWGGAFASLAVPALRKAESEAAAAQVPEVAPKQEDPLIKK